MDCRAQSQCPAILQLDQNGLQYLREMEQRWFGTPSSKVADHKQTNSSVLYSYALLGIQFRKAETKWLVIPLGKDWANEQMACQNYVTPENGNHIQFFFPKNFWFPPLKTSGHLLSTRVFKLKPLWKKHGFMPIFLAHFSFLNRAAAVNCHHEKQLSVIAYMKICDTINQGF